MAGSGDPRVRRGNKLPPPNGPADGESRNGGRGGASVGELGLAGALQRPLIGRPGKAKRGLKNPAKAMGLGMSLVAKAFMAEVVIPAIGVGANAAA